MGGCLFESFSSFRYKIKLPQPTLIPEINSKHSYTVFTCQITLNTIIIIPCNKISQPNRKTFKQYSKTCWAKKCNKNCKHFYTLLCLRLSFFVVVWYWRRWQCSQSAVNIRCCTHNESGGRQRGVKWNFSCRQTLLFFVRFVLYSLWYLHFFSLSFDLIEVVEKKIQLFFFHFHFLVCFVVVNEWRKIVLQHFSVFITHGYRIWEAAFISISSALHPSQLFLFFPFI